MSMMSVLQFQSSSISLLLKLIDTAIEKFQLDALVSKVQISPD